MKELLQSLKSINRLLLVFLLLEKKQGAPSTCVSWVNTLAFGLMGGQASRDLYSWRKLSPCRFSYVSCLQKLAAKHLVVGQKRPTTIWEIAFDGRWVYHFLYLSSFMKDIAASFDNLQLECLILLDFHWMWV